MAITNLLEQIPNGVLQGVGGRARNDDPIRALRRAQDVLFFERESLRAQHPTSEDVVRAEVALVGPAGVGEVAIDAE